MVASDTVVGIVGAVVLVAVMAGVFVYEYNNPAEAGEGGGSDAEHLFADTYPELNATEDIDQDGVANLDDDDLDGDGTPNANDTMVNVKVPLTGSRGPTLPNAMDAGASFAVVIGTGAQHLNGTLTYTTTTTAPTPADRTLSAQLVDGAGQAVATATLTRSGTTATLTFDAPDVPAGNYTLVVRQSAAGPATAFNGSVFVHYPGPMAMDHEHT